MAINIPDTAMVFAAGLGKRMQPLTANKPKPLIEVGGRTMLDRAIDHLVMVGVKRAVVNTHYLPEQINKHLEKRRDIDIILSHEPELLETGGGLKKARVHLGNNPIYVVNSDIVWMDGREPALVRLAKAWDAVHSKNTATSPHASSCGLTAGSSPDAPLDPAIKSQGDGIDLLLLLAEKSKATGYDGDGDFDLSLNGELQRPEGVKPYVFTGVQMLHPSILSDAPSGAFSLNRYYFNNPKAYGLVHDGAWLHIGTPEGLEKAEKYLGRDER